jgi:peroxiredoxin
MAARKQPALPAPGTLAPGFRLARLEGGEAALADLIQRGPILLAFFKISCPICQLTLPFLERIHAEAAMPIYAISQDDARDTRDFNREFKLTLPTLLDSEDQDYPASKAYGLSHVPTMFQIGIDGKIERVLEGWNKQEIEALGESVGVRVIRATDNVPAWKSG